MTARKQGTVSPEVFGEVQLLLAEKRTSLASLRTGIAVFALPLSVLGLLVATSKYYEAGRVLHFLLPLLAISAALAILGAFLVIRSVSHIRHQEKLICQIKQKYSAISEFLD